MTEEAIQKIKYRCLCPKCKGIHTVSYSPGSCEAVVECLTCGKLYYSLLYEHMSFRGEDTLEEYQIPITSEEFETIKTIPFKDLELQFLARREARLLFAGEVSKLDSDLAQKRCGR